MVVFNNNNLCKIGIMSYIVKSTSLQIYGTFVGVLSGRFYE